MSVFSKFFSNSKSFQSESKTENEPSKITFASIQNFLDNLLVSDKYIAKSDYIKYFLGNSELIDYVQKLKTDGFLKDYCKKNGLKVKNVENSLQNISEINVLVKNHNQEFVERKLKSEKEYLDSILKEIDPAINLDDDQRKVILTDEDYCLVIAGAGAGKTTTVAAKVKYLVEKQNVKPEEILVVSFTNKAVDELKEKIQKGLKISCPITTFHSTGNAILHKQNDEKLNIVQNEKLYFVLEDYFKDSVLQNERIVNDLVKFFASYCDAPADEIVDKAILFNKISSSSFSTLKSELGEYEKKLIPAGSKKYMTIQDEQLRSNEEVQIANFLYLNNIEYEYEPRYKFNIPGAKKPYTPDFIIRQNGNEAYIEHFGVTENGYSSRYTKEELEKYNRAMHDKVALHRLHNTKLICTCSKYSDGKELTEHLKTKLEEFGFVLNLKDNREVMKKINA